jgi:hypothetical protein
MQLSFCKQLSMLALCSCCALLLSLIHTSTDAFVISPHPRPNQILFQNNALVIQLHPQRRSQYSYSPLQLAAGGFGGSDSATAKKEIKLKPKQQWDRYIALKKETPIKVGVKVVSTEADSNWLEVGSVRSQADIPSDVAVARQRALIAEVRLHLITGG